MIALARNLTLLLGEYSTINTTIKYYQQSKN